MACLLERSGGVIVSVQKPDTWRIEVNETGNQFDSIEITAPGIALDDEFPKKGIFPSGMALDMIGETTDLNIARHAIVCMGISGFHEAMEVIRVDGVKLAEPHPKGGGSAKEIEMWEWLQKEFLYVLDTYIDRYPVGVTE